MSRSSIVVGAAVALALLVTGCAATPASSGGVSDKSVTLYSGRSESLVKPVLEQFTAATGIAVDVRYGDTAQLAAQLVEEGACLLYTSPSPRDRTRSRMPSSA